MRMQRLCASLSVLTLAVSQPAYACFPVDMKLEDVRNADIVAIGSIENYKIVKTREVDFDTREFRELMKNENKKSRFDEKVSLFWKYAQFEIKIDRVVAGEIPQKSLMVVWGASGLGYPTEIEDGSYLIALRRAELVGPGDDVGTVAFSTGYAMLQAPCSGAFLYKESSEQAREIRKIVREQGLNPLQGEIGKTLPALPPVQ